MGVLGTVALIDGANATTKTTKSREGGTNLVREVVESARSVDYDKVTGAALPGELMAKPALADAEGASGWQVRRRNVLYTVTVDACLFDDAKDGGGPHTGGTYCANSTAAGTSDANADDYRRVVVATEWGPTTARRRVEQTAILTNPSGGLGPRIICVKTANCANPSSTITQFSTTTVNFEVQSASADAVRWSVDDNGQNGDASGGPTAWTFGWPIGSHGTYQCGVSPTWSVDGDYLVNAQAFDARGIPGDLRTEPVSLDRAAPAAPCGLTGGRNGAVVDLNWLKNPERDIAGYRVFRVAIGSETSDPQVCALTSSLSCFDTNPPSAGDADPIFYYVRAYDATRNTASATLSVSQASNSAPDPPPTLTVTVVDGQAVLELGCGERLRRLDHLLPDLSRRHRPRRPPRRDGRCDAARLHRCEGLQPGAPVLGDGGRQPVSGVGSCRSGDPVRRMSDESGFTLVELILTMAILMAVLGATLGTLENFVGRTKVNERQNESQDKARFTMDRLAREVRNLASPTNAAVNSIDKATDYDFVFKTVAQAKRRVRYCLNSDTSEFWIQTQSFSVGDVDPGLPSTATCPATGGWTTQRVASQHVVNQRDGLDRNVFTYVGLVGTDTSRVTSVRADLYVDVNPGKSPKETADLDG